MKKIDFINFIDKNVDFSKAEEDIRNYWNAYKQTKEVEKPMFTENGKLILKYMREHSTDLPMAKSKTIAEGIGISSRGVAGAMRKLVSDNYVNKVGENPTIYQLSDSGRTITID